MTQRGKLIAMAATMGLCLLWVVWGIELDKVIAAVAALHLGYIPGVFACQAVAFCVRAWRFNLIIGDDAPSYGRQLVVTAIGSLGLNVLPLRMGEFVRPWLLTRDGLEMSRTLGAVVVERVLDLAILLGLVLLVAFGLELPTDQIVVRGVDVLQAGQQASGFALVLAGAVLVGFVAAGEPAAALVAKVPKIGVALANAILSFRSAATSLLARPWTCAVVVVQTVAVWSLLVVAVWTLLQAFEGVPTELSAALMMYVAIVCASIAVPTPGFFGPFEVTGQAVLMMWGTDAGISTAVAVILHLVFFAFNTGIGAIFLLRDGLSLTTLVRESQQAAPS